MSFIYVGIYWNNHHHLLQIADHVDGRVLWANLHLLFWLSLFPFVTGWMGENHFSTLPVATYGFVLLMAALAYYLLQCSIIGKQRQASALAHAIGRDIKGKISPILYASAIPLAFVHSAIAGTIYIVVALMWLIPDKRIESALEKKNGHNGE